MNPLTHAAVAGACCGASPFLLSVILIEVIEVADEYCKFLLPQISMCYKSVKDITVTNLL